MNRLLVAALAAVDAVVAAAVGLGVVVAPLVLLWFTAFSGADWGALWPAAAHIWQLGNLVPLDIRLDDLFLAATGVASDASRFVVSLAPLAFVGFVLLFSAGSGRRAARAGDWIAGVAAGAGATVVISIVVLTTSGTLSVSVAAWQAICFPVLLYLGGSLAGAVTTAWADGDDGLIDALHDRVDALAPHWRALPGLAVRGTAIACVGLIVLGGLGLLASVLTRGGEMISLFQAAQVDGVGATTLTLAHLAYLPTLLVWSIAWIAGPGFAVGAATTVSPSVSDLGVVPSLPVFGLLPEYAAPFLLLVVLAPVAVGALAGLSMRVLLFQEWRAEGMDDDGAEPFLPRIALAAAAAALTAGAAALLSAMASGGIGPGRLADVGPHPGLVALAVGVEVLIGAAILLLAPRRRSREWVDVDD